MTPETFWTRARSDATNPDSCWNWSGKTAAGYGQAWINGTGKRRGAHVIAYELAIGPIPDGLELDHTCNNTRCVNPAHLEPVTHAENMQRWWDRGGPRRREQIAAVLNGYAS